MVYHLKGRVVKHMVPCCIPIKINLLIFKHKKELYL